MAVTLYQGAADAILVRLPSRIADVVYSDPPFGTGLVWSGKAGSFSDKFRFDVTKMNALAAAHPAIADMISVIARSPDDKAYLIMMADLLLGCHRSLKLPGSLWLHCDDTMSHYIKVIGDLVFGTGSFLGQVIWRRTGSHSSSSRSFGRVHDTILVFARSRVTAWRLARLKCEFHYGDPMSFVFVDGLAEDRLSSSSKERVGYPTQKPVALLKRLIRSACPVDGTVLDPTCGSGTTIVAARELGMNAIGIDLSAAAIASCKKRLETKFQPSLFGVAA